MKKFAIIIFLMFPIVCSVGQQRVFQVNLSSEDGNLPIIFENCANVVTIKLYSWPYGNPEKKTEVKDLKPLSVLCPPEQGSVTRESDTKLAITASSYKMRLLATYEGLTIGIFNFATAQAPRAGGLKVKYNKEVLLAEGKDLPSRAENIIVDAFPNPDFVKTNSSDATYFVRDYDIRFGRNNIHVKGRFFDLKPYRLHPGDTMAISATVGRVTYRGDTTVSMPVFRKIPVR